MFVQEAVYKRSVHTGRGDGIAADSFFDVVPCYAQGHRQNSTLAHALGKSICDP